MRVGIRQFSYVWPMVFILVLFVDAFVPSLGIALALFYLATTTAGSLAIYTLERQRLIDYLYVRYPAEWKRLTFPFISSVQQPWLYSFARSKIDYGDSNLVMLKRSFRQAAWLALAVFFHQPLVLGILFWRLASMG